MVDRGNCHFVKKVQNIQNFGGMMALISDYNKETHTVMSDDGQGHSIKIPSFLIGKEDGKKIKEAIHQVQEERIKDLKSNNEDWIQDTNTTKDSRESRNFVNKVKDRK